VATGTVSTNSVSASSGSFSTALTAGSITCNGSVFIDRSPANTAEYRLYNGNAVTEWVMGQRSSSDHDFKVSTLVSGTYTTRLTVTRTGQLRIGSGSLFGYEEGSWTPTIDYTAAAPTSITYTRQYGRYNVMGKTVTLTYHLSFDYGLGATGSYFLIRGIPAGLALTTQTEVSQSCFRGTFAGLANPFYTTLWVAGGTLPGVTTFDGRTMTIGAYNAGNYITGAYQALGASGQDMWGTLTYTLP
jgi:hypothetical protein